MCVIAPHIRFVSWLIPMIRTVTREPLGGLLLFGYEQRQSIPPSSETKTPFVSTMLTVPTYLLPGTYLRSAFSYGFSVACLEDGKYGRAIINNSKNKIILNLEQDEAKHVQEVLKLSRTEVRSITQFERGEALISNNNNKVPVIVKTSKIEAQIITTDRAELAALLREKEKQKKP